MTFNFLFTRRFQRCVIRQGSSQHRFGAAATPITNPTMIAAGGNGPLVESHPRANLARRRIGLIGDNPPSKRMWLGEVLIGCLPLKTLLCSSGDASPQHWIVLRGIHPINPHKKHIRLLGGSSLVNMMRWSGTQGILRGSRGPFPPAAAMVVMVVLLLGVTSPIYFLFPRRLTYLTTTTNPSGELNYFYSTIFTLLS